MRPVFFLVAAALFALPLCLPAAAQSRRAPGVLTLDRILPEVRRTHPGQFYDADGPTGSPDGSEHYHLKWMTPDGRIEWLDTDARTGRVLGASPGRDNFDGPGPERYYAPAPSYPLPQNYGPQNYGPRNYGSPRDYGGGFRGWSGGSGGYGGQRGRDYGGGGGGGRNFGGGGARRGHGR